MKRSRGFTIVELVVVMTIMAILLALGTVMLSSTQVNARNVQRAADIESIAKGLESRYVKGNPIIAETVVPYVKKGTYPSINEIRHAENASGLTDFPATSGIYIEKILPGTTRENFFPPNPTSATVAITDSFKVICTTACGAAGTAATINTALGTGSNVYVYEPIDASNNVCLNSACVRYNLYYLPEGSATPIVKASKHQ